jgi:hypothetical protein
MYVTIWLLDAKARYGGLLCKLKGPEPEFVYVLRSPGIDFEESIPPAYVAWRAGTTNRVFIMGPTGWELIRGLLKRFTNTGSKVHIAIELIFTCVLVLINPLYFH